MLAKGLAFGAMRCASIAPYAVAVCRSNALPAHGGQQAAHPTQAGQAWPIASQWISPVGHAEHRRSARGSRRGLFERPKDASSAAAVSDEKHREPVAAGGGRVSRVAFSLDTFFWRSKRKYLGRGTNSRFISIARQRTKPAVPLPPWRAAAGAQDAKERADTANARQVLTIVLKFLANILVKQLLLRFGLHGVVIV